MASSSCHDPAYIIFFGPTRAGKDFCANQIRCSSEQPFIDGPSDNSVSKTISERVAWNNSDIVVTVPGSLDSDGEDLEHQAAFIDYVKGKNVRALVFVYTGGLNQFIKATLKAFEQSDIKSNVILLKNQMRDDIPVEPYEGFQKLNVKMYTAPYMDHVPRTEFDTLKSMLVRMQPILIENMVVSSTLFKHPLVQKGSTIVEEFEEDIVIPTKELIKSSRQEVVMVPGTRTEWIWWHGINTNQKKTVPCVRAETRTLESTREEIVNKPAKVYRVCKLMLAERFDGVIDVYAKEMLPSRTEVL